MARKRPTPPGLSEASAPFTPDRLSLEQMLQLNAAVLDAYDYTCALTGARFNAETARSANIVVIPIHPVETGGRLVGNNMLPLVPKAADAFRDGDFTIGVGFEIIVDMSWIESDMLRMLPRSGKLLLPQNRQFVPDADSLHYHRHTIFQAVGG